MQTLAALVLAATLQTNAPDPNNLSFGREGSLTVQPGQLVDTATGQVVTLDAVARSAEGKPFFFLGEQHATAAHQQLEADVVRVLTEHARKVSVGMEMFTRVKQDVLDQWPLGKLSEEEFLKDADWKGQWGYPYEFYRPVFDTVRANHLPLIGLNVPRDWVRTVGRSGVEGLPTSAKIQLPSTLYLGNKEHRTLFEAMIGGAHPGMSQTSFDHMYAAQVLWDEGMADTALKVRGLTPATPKDIFVVIAGAGHIMYKQGIPYRIKIHHGGEGVSLVMLQSDTPVTVSRGIGDYVFVSVKPPEK